MSDGIGPVTLTEGQPAAAPEGTTATAPEVSTGQAQSQTDAGQGQASTAPATPDEPTFFDPNSIPEELKPAYKQMQAAFTKKMQGISGDKQKIEAYNAFMSDPIGQMQSGGPTIWVQSDSGGSSGGNQSRSTSARTAAMGTAILG